jgi:hypothetical protein
MKIIKRAHVGCRFFNLLFIFITMLTLIKDKAALKNKVRTRYTCIFTCPAGSLRIKVHKFGANHPPGGRTREARRRAQKLKMQSASSSRCFCTFALHLERGAQFHFRLGFASKLNTCCIPGDNFAPLNKNEVRGAFVFGAARLSPAAGAFWQLIKFLVGV